MSGKTIEIRSRECGEFDCYLSTPSSEAKCRLSCLPPRCTASTRTSASLPTSSPGTAILRLRPTCSGARPGPFPTRTARRERSQPRLEKIRVGEADMADTLAHCARLPQINGRAAAMGFCYGGPTRSSVPSGWATTPASPATAPACWTSSRSSTASLRRSASSGATRITRRRPRCSRPIATCRRACRTSRCTSSRACCTAT